MKSFISLSLGIIIALGIFIGLRKIGEHIIFINTIGELDGISAAIIKSLDVNSDVDEAKELKDDLYNTIKKNRNSIIILATENDNDKLFYAPSAEVKRNKDIYNEFLISIDKSVKIKRNMSIVKVEIGEQYKVYIEKSIDLIVIIIKEMVSFCISFALLILYILLFTSKNNEVSDENK